MTALRTSTLTARHIGERVSVITKRGGIVGILNSVAYIGETDPQPTALHLTATEPVDHPATIPWHAVISFARMPDPDTPALTTRVDTALEELAESRSLILELGRRLRRDGHTAHALAADSITTCIEEAIAALTGEAP